MSSSVDQIKSRIDIVTLVSSYIPLERAGGNYKGKCPFHNEKTPSFFVSPDRGSYYCFGCHAKGDIFTFVQEFEGIDFIGSLKMLAERAGVTLERYDEQNKSEKETLMSVMEQAVFFYQKKLSEHAPAREYLKSRAVSDATITDFRIGYAPAEWRELREYLLGKGVSDADMLKAGLVKQASKDGRETVYDTFRGRIMFPIADSSGRVVAFSGRILIPDDKSPKYLNSPETEIFNKSEILFGLDKAKKDIRVKDYSILVEGQMDLIMLHQAGIGNTVASSGTALSSEHLVKLRRLSSRLIMAYDGDSAGFAATDRSAKLALSLGMELKIAEMPTGKDPADLASIDVKDLAKRLADAKHIIDFYTDSLLARGLDRRDLGQEIKVHVLPYVAILSSSIERAHFIKNIATKAFIKEEALWDDLKHVSVSDTRPQEVHSSGVHEKVKKQDMLERKAIGIVWWRRECAEKNIEISPQTETKVDAALDHLALEKRVKEIMKERYDELSRELESEKEELLFETESYYNNSTTISREIQEIISGLEEEYLKKTLMDAMEKLQKAEQLRDSALVLQLLEECQRISGRINIIKQSRSG